MRLLKTHPILGLLNSYLVDSPQPSNISYMCLGIQILTGVFLAMHYTPSVDLAFISVEHTFLSPIDVLIKLRYMLENPLSL